RSLNVLTIDHPVRKQENLSFHYCVRLDTFAFATDPEGPTAASRIKRPHLSAVNF
ncbi:hypothetical protein P3T43_000655, partial [Paraburkholderia sp. GAS41]